MRRFGFLFVLLIAVLLLTSSAYASSFDLRLTYWRPCITGLDESPIGIVWREIDEDNSYLYETTYFTLHPIPTGVLTNYLITSGSYPLSVKDRLTASYWSVKGEASFGSLNPIDFEALEPKDKDYLSTTPPDIDFEGIRFYPRPENIAHGSKNAGFSVFDMAFQRSLADDETLKTNLKIGLSYVGFTRHTVYTLIQKDSERSVLYTDLSKDVSQSAKMFGPTIGIEGTIPVFQGSAGGKVSLGALVGAFNDKCKYHYTSTYNPNGLPIDTKPQLVYRAHESYRRTVPTLNVEIAFNYPLTTSLTLEAGGKYHAFYIPDPICHEPYGNALVRDHEPRVISVGGVMVGVRYGF